MGTQGLTTAGGLYYFRPNENKVYRWCCWNSKLSSPGRGATYQELELLAVWVRNISKLWGDKCLTLSFLLLSSLLQVPPMDQRQQEARSRGVCVRT